MECCYRLYTWISYTVLMLLLQIFWKISQLSDYFKQKSDEDIKSDMGFVCSPLTKESKLRRHIRSMSDVQSSTPCRMPFRLKKGHWSISHDSDPKARRIPLRDRYHDSSDSSDSCESLNQRIAEYKMRKHSDSIRIQLYGQRAP